MNSANNSKYRGWRCLLGSPAVPGWLMVTGLFYYLIVLHYLKAPTTPTTSAVFFGATMLWSIAVVMPRLVALRTVQLDWWFLSFVLILLAWAIQQWSTGSGIYTYYKYLPAFVVLPYLVGRTFRLVDVELFLRILVIAAVLLLPLLAMELLALPRGTVRGWLFSHVHGAQLAGLALSLGSVVLVGWLSVRVDDIAGGRIPKIGGIAVLSACSFLLPLTSARGVLLAMVMASFVLLSLGSCSRKWRSFIGLVVVAPIGAGLLISNAMVWYLDYGVQGAVWVVEHGNADRDITKSEVPIPANGAAERCAELFGDATHAGNSVAARVQLWLDSYAIMKLGPLFGVGPGHFRDNSCAPYPHSTVWQALAELGVVGALPLLILMGMAAISLFRERETRKAGRGVPQVFSLLGILVLICITDQIYGNYFQAGLFFLACGIAGALVQRRVQSRGVHEST